ncbi:DUF1674 domain protein [Microthyrium microscopicum]|uniref:Succinate dehydrogenase assembly factor 4, mitochondrial n=1 Tax=Microthyrium microscopicum TaxID=703497 RepID=A0A6A6TYZ8_9PEZI|nr:DUF1674 domain protein [Microthyrium microscopicum]
MPIRLISRSACRIAPPHPTRSLLLHIRHASFGPTASPPRLPKEEQEIFEELQRRSTGAFSQPREEAKESQPSELKSSESTTPEATKSEEVHPNLRRGAPPEFAGDTNPKTGEVGGPKNEPQRWGPGSDYSYNGRVTDF